MTTVPTNIALTEHSFFQMPVAARNGTLEVLNEQKGMNIGTLRAVNPDGTTCYCIMGAIAEAYRRAKGEGDWMPTVSVTDSVVTDYEFVLDGKAGPFRDTVPLEVLGWAGMAIPVHDLDTDEHDWIYPLIALDGRLTIPAHLMTLNDVASLKPKEFIELLS